MRTLSVCPQCNALNRVDLSSAEPAEKKKPVCGKCRADLPVKGAVTELSASGLSRVVEKSDLPVVVDFWAPWCGPCRAFAPVYESVARQRASDFVFAKLDTQAHPLAGDAYRIRGIPTLVVFRNGLERARVSGAMSALQFESWLDDVLRG